MIKGLVTTAALSIAIIGCVAAGVFLTSPLTLPVDMSGAWGEFFAQISATILGALVAAYVAFRVAADARKAARRDDAFRCVMKVSLIVNDFQSIMEAIDESLSAMNDMQQSHRLMWERVKPIAGLREAISIEASELAPFHEGGA